MITDGLLIVLLLSVMGFVFTNRFILLHRLDEAGILIQVGNFEGYLNKTAWSITSFVQTHGFYESRTSGMINRDHFVPWDSFTRAVFDYQRRVVSLIWGNSRITKVYCYPENVDKVFKAIQGHLPELEE